MRPDPNDHSTGTEPARIIYLGEVRRRRASQQRAPGIQYVAAISICSLMAWALWASVLFSLGPVRLLTYLAFFVPLWAALAGTATVGLFVFEWRRGLLPKLARCGTRGLVFASVIVLNLALQAAHDWSIIVAGGSLLVAATIETVLERRQSSFS